MNRGIRGDTIVEVMLAILVAGVALAVAYQLSNASLRTSSQSVQRSQALSVGSAQIERLKNCYYQPACSWFGGAFRVPNEGDFCVSDQDQPLRPTTIWCKNFEGSIFSVDDHYDGPSDTFTITVTWDNINGHGTDRQVLYYRFPQ